MVKIPEWFKIGAKIWFQGFGNEVEVIFIDDGECHLDPKDEEGHWIGRDIDGLHMVPLNEVDAHWLPYHIDFRKNKGKRNANRRKRT